MFTPYVPYPPNSGGRTRTFNLIKNLSKKHEITSFSFLRTDHNEPDLTELKKYCKKIEIFKRKKSFQSLAKILRTGFSPFPYLVNMYRDPSVTKAIAKELYDNKYDLIHVETYYIMPNLPETSVPILLAEQTIEYLVYQHYAESTSLIPLKPLFYIDAAKHKYWEKQYWIKAKRVVAMSADDREKMLDLITDLDVDVVPNGVDMAFFSQKVATLPKKGTRVLFVGNFNWLQNREAALILAQKIWPRLKLRLPGASLWIVGREPTEEIRNLAGDDIVVSSDIDDIRVAYQGSDLLLAPIYGGGGTRYKILEAMASGVPVVTTPIGIEGIGAKDKEHVLIGNNADDLVNLSLKIITDKTLKSKIASQAKKFVEKNYDWSLISTNLDEIYEQTAKRS